MAPKQDFEHKTIRRRLWVMFGVVSCFIALLVASFISDAFVLKADLLAVERFYGLLNDVLELRRYEKNLLYQGEVENYDQVLTYLDRIAESAEHLVPAIRRVTEADEIAAFRADLRRYRRLVENGHRRGAYPSASIRHVGKKLVDFSQRLLFLKKTQIHRSLQRTTLIFVTLTAGVFVMVMLFFSIQARNILRRLSLIQQAAREVAHGRFVPIPEGSRVKDEISGLIQAFNKMVEELDLRQEELVEAKKLAAIGTFSSGIAHELNNPLNNISLTVDTLLEEFETIPREEAREFLDDIALQTERASTVVKNLLDFSRETLPTTEVLRIEEVVRRTGELVANQLRISSVRLEEDFPEGGLPPVRGHFQKLQQVFLNLFLNAIHAMPAGGRIRIRGSAGPEGYIRIDFTDTGVGIPAEKLDRIFEPFYTTKPVGKGTGLGLSIVYGIIQKHGGYIEVRSERNRGTTFHIYLPAVQRRKEEGA